jgi:hypothetical protein
MRKDIQAINEAYDNAIKGDTKIALNGDVFTLPNGQKVVYNVDEYEEDDDRWVAHSLVDAETGRSFAVLQPGEGIESRGDALKSAIQKRIDNIDMSKMQKIGNLVPSL